MDTLGKKGTGQGEAACLPAGAQPLRIEGIGDAPLTAEPDDAELAAEAVLEMMCDGRWNMEDVSHQPSAISHQPSADGRQPQEGTREYYEALAVRIRRAHEAERRAATRATAYCEQRLSQERLPDQGEGSLAYVEETLYKHLDTIEREGGELKRRWQHCLADVTVRRLNIGDYDRDEDK